MSLLRVLLLCFAVSIFMPASALAGLIATVSSEAGPWSYVPGGLNTSYQYGIGDQSAPALVSAADGLAFLAGDLLTVTYISGLTNPYGLTCPGSWCYDADGVGAQNALKSYTSGTYMPSYYIPAAEYDVGFMALVGVFVDINGAIVGTPHKLGDGPTALVIPTGATQFQMGLNDDIYSDNSGSLTVNVSETSSASPEPSTWGLMIGCLLGLLLRAGCRHRVAAARSAG